MLFSEKLKAICEKYGIKNSDLAKKCGIDPSLLSRFTNGKRIPAKDSETVRAIAHGLAEIIQSKMPPSDAEGSNNTAYNESTSHDAGTKRQTNGTKQDTASTAATDDIIKKESPNAMTDEAACASIPDFCEPADENALYEWLNADGSGLRDPRNAYGSKKKECRSFSGEYTAARLSFLLDMFGISNSLFARALGVDPSLVSRYRTGQRLLPDSKELFDNLCRFFFECASARSMEKEFAAQLGIEADYSELSAEDRQLAFVNYMTGKSQEISHKNALSLIKALCSAKVPEFSGDLPKINLPFFKNDLYTGFDGLCSALSRAAKQLYDSKQPKNLFLYAGELLPRLAASSGITLFIRYLSELLRRGFSLKLVLTEPASEAEALKLIASVSPFVMTEKTEVLVLPHTEAPIFDGFILAADGLCGVYGFYSAGSADSAHFRFVSDSDGLAFLAAQTDSILKKAEPYISLCRDASSDGFRFFSDALCSAPGELNALYTSFSPGTLGEAAAEMLLDRNDTELIRYIASSSAFFEEALASGSLTEYIVLHDKKEIASGEAYLDLKGMMGKRRIAYSAAAYREHALNVAALRGKYPQYRVAVIIGELSDDVQILSKKNVGTMIITDERAFLIKSEALHGALVAMLRFIGKKM